MLSTYQTVLQKLLKNIGMLPYHILDLKQEKLPSSHEIKIWANKYKVPYDFVENYFVEQWNGKMKYELTNARIQTPNEVRNFGTSTFELNPDFSFVINDDYTIEIDNAEKDK